MKETVLRIRVSESGAELDSFTFSKDDAREYLQRMRLDQRRRDTYEEVLALFD